MRQFISYPKSGRTWIRYILSIMDCEPLISFHHDTFEFNDARKPPLDFDLDKRLAHFGASDKIVYLDRDPRDVMVSLYHQVTGRFVDFFEYRATISEFIRDDYFGAQNLKSFRDMWRQILNQRNYMAISYEDCHADMFAVLCKTLRYLDIDFDPAKLERAIAAGAFEEMARVEAAGAFPHPWLRPRNTAPKVRRGRVGGFRTALGAADIEYLNGVFDLSNTA